MLSLLHVLRIQALTLGAEIERRSDRTPPPHDFATLPGSFSHESKPDFPLLFIAVGAVLGHIAATGHFTFHRSAGAKRTGGLAGQEAPQASCSEGLNKAKVLAMAGPAAASTAVQAQEASSGKKPNIVFIMGDDVGWFNIGAYHRGIMAGKTPNLDALATQGMLFTDYYAEASCTAGRANFITGQIPIRTGLTTVGQAGATVGMPAQRPSPPSSRRKATPPASSARTTWATATSTCRPCTASTSSLATSITWTRWRIRPIPTIRRS